MQAARWRNMAMVAVSMMVLHGARAADEQPRALETTVILAPRGNASAELKAAVADALYVKLGSMVEENGGIAFNPNDWNLNLRSRGARPEQCKDVACDLDLAKTHGASRAIGGEIMVVGDTAYFTLKAVQPRGARVEKVIEAPASRLVAALDAVAEQLVPRPRQAGVSAAGGRRTGTLLLVFTQFPGESTVRVEAMPGGRSFAWNASYNRIKTNGVQTLDLKADAAGLLKTGDLSDAVAEQLAAQHKAENVVWVRVTVREVAAPNARGKEWMSVVGTIEAARFHHQLRMAAREKVGFEASCKRPAVTDPDCIREDMGRGLDAVLVRVLPIAMNEDTPGAMPGR